MQRPESDDRGWSAGLVQRWLVSGLPAGTAAGSVQRQDPLTAVLKRTLMNGRRSVQRDAAFEVGESVAEHDASAVQP